MKYSLNVAATHPKHEDFEKDHAHDTAAIVTKALEDAGHVVHHVSINHGNLKGGSYDHFEHLKTEKEKTEADAQEAKAQAVEAAE